MLPAKKSDDLNLRLVTVRSALVVTAMSLWLAGSALCFKDVQEYTLIHWSNGIVLLFYSKQEVFPEVTTLQQQCSNDCYNVTTFLNDKNTFKSKSFVWTSIDSWRLSNSILFIGLTQDSSSDRVASLCRYSSVNRFVKVWKVLFWEDAVSPQYSRPRLVVRDVLWMRLWKRISSVLAVNVRPVS